jgi:sugar phosphate isomerase/epimerase
VEHKLSSAPVQLGVFSKTYGSGTVSDIFRRIKNDRLELVHYNMSSSGLGAFPEHVSEPHCREILRSARDNELRVIGLSATFNMIHPDPSVREQGIGSFETLAAAAPKMGTRYLSLCTGSRNPTERWAWHPDNARPEAWHDLLRTLAELVQIAEKHDLVLGIEPEIGNVVRTARLARRLLDEVKSDRLQIILDPANLFDTATSVSEIDDLMVEAVSLLHEDITVAHAKDRTLDGRTCAAGNGAVDFRFFASLLKEMQFAGPLVLHGLDEDEVSPSVRMLTEALS